MLLASGRSRRMGGGDKGPASASWRSQRASRSPAARIVLLQDLGARFLDCFHQVIRQMGGN